MTVTYVTSFIELHSALLDFKILGARWIFRGQGKASWPLIPKAGRLQWPEGKTDLDLFTVGWKRRALEYATFVAESEWDWLAVAQHHGLATRLLDWTMNPLAATFFALETDTGEDSAVYAHLPLRAIQPKSIGIADFSGIAFLRPRGVVQRIGRQNAFFTVHGPPTVDLKEGGEEVGELRRIVISRGARRAILQDLDYYGVNRATLFPDLDGLSAYFNWYAENGFNIPKHPEGVLEAIQKRDEAEKEKKAAQSQVAELRTPTDA